MNYCARSFLRRGLISVIAFSWPASVPFAFSQDSPNRDGPVEFSLRFERTDVPVEKRLFRADASLLEQTFVVEAMLESFESRQIYQHVSADELATVKELATLNQRCLLYPSGRLSRGPTKKMSDFFRALVESVPQETRLPDAELEFFLSDAADEGYVTLLFSNQLYTRNRLRSPDSFRRLQNLVGVEIIAPTREVAEQRAETLVKLLQLAIADPVRRYTDKREAELVAELEEAEKEQRDTQQQLAMLEEAASNSTRFDADELKRFKFQQQLLEIDLAGIRAKMKAAVEMRQRHQNDDTIGRQIDEILVAEEIELAGLTARKVALAKLFEQATQSVGLADKKGQLKAEEIRLSERSNRARAELKRLAPMLEAAEGLLLPGKESIKIAPIKWIQ